MYDELVMALRVCGDEPYDITKPCKVSPWKLMRDAADAIERLTAEVDRLKQIPEIRHQLRHEAWVKEYQEQHGATPHRDIDSRNGV